MSMMVSRTTRLKQFAAVHGDKYDYSLMADDLKAKDKFNVICRVHDTVFSIHANNHLSGKGCPACGIDTISRKKLKGWDKWVEDFNRVHDGKYNYALNTEITNNSILRIICPAHKTFTQVASSHMQGAGCPECARARTIAGNTISKAEWVDRFTEVWGDRYDFSKWAGNSSNVGEVRCKQHNTLFYSNGDNLYRGHGCPSCSIAVSKPETDIRNFIEAHGFEVVSRYRPDWMGGKELDLFIPDVNLAIEYNGSHVHGSNMNCFGTAPKHPKYHYRKWETCRNNGVTLLSIYDFKWRLQKPQYLQKILHHLKLDTRLQARKCSVGVCSRDEAKAMYNAHSLEGSAPMPLDAEHLALYYNGKMVMCASFGMRQSMNTGQDEVLRIVTLPGVTVVGGSSRLRSRYPTYRMLATNDSGGVSGGLYLSSRYWWVSPSTTNYMTRAAASKQRREKETGGTQAEGESEVKFMTRMGWYQVFDSGIMEI